MMGLKNNRHGLLLLLGGLQDIEKPAGPSIASRRLPFEALSPCFGERYRSSRQRAVGVPSGRGNAAAGDVRRHIRFVVRADSACPPSTGGCPRGCPPARGGARMPATVKKGANPRRGRREEEGRGLIVGRCGSPSPRRRSSGSPAPSRRSNGNCTPVVPLCLNRGNLRSPRVPPQAAACGKDLRSSRRPPRARRACLAPQCAPRRARRCGPPREPWKRDAR